MTLDTMSDLTRDIMELADNDITDKVRPYLSQRLMIHLLASGYSHLYLQAAAFFSWLLNGNYQLVFGKPVKGTPP